MPYFLYPGTLRLNECFEIKGREVRHIRQARKIRAGERIELQDQCLRRFICEVEMTRNQFVRFKPIAPIDSPAPSRFGIDLYLPLLKEKPLDWTLQKSVELGARSINLFQCNQSRRLPRGAARENKSARWQTILWEACKQCERVSPPELRFAGELEETLEKIGDHMKVIAFDPQGTSALAESLGQTSEVCVLIGPEAGFSDIVGMDTVSRISLGPRILRAETAAVTAMALLQYLKGDLKE